MSTATMARPGTIEKETAESVLHLDALPGQRTSFTLVEESESSWGKHGTEHAEALIDNRMFDAHVAALVMNLDYDIRAGLDPLALSTDRRTLGQVMHDCWKHSKHHRSKIVNEVLPRKKGRLPQKKRRSERAEHKALKAQLRDVKMRRSF